MAFATGGLDGGNAIASWNCAPRGNLGLGTAVAERTAHLAAGRALRARDANAAAVRAAVVRIARVVRIVDALHPGGTRQTEESATRDDIVVVFHAHSWAVGASVVRVAAII